MKRTQIIDRRYKGYLIKPTLHGFKVYRGGHYIDEYPDMNTVRCRIDQAVAKRDDMAGKPAPEDGVRAARRDHQKGQTNLF